MTGENPDLTGNFPEMPSSHNIPQLSEPMINDVRRQLELTNPFLQKDKIVAGIRGMGGSFSVRCIEQNGENGRRLLTQLDSTIGQLGKHGADVAIGFVLELFDRASDGKLSTKLSSDFELQELLVKGLETRLTAKQGETIFGATLRNPPVPETEQPDMVGLIRELNLSTLLRSFNFSASTSATYGVLSMMWPQMGISPVADVPPIEPPPAPPPAS